MKINTDIKNLLMQLKTKGYRYYEDDGVVPTLVDEVLSWAGPLEEGEGYYVEEHARKKSADVFIIKNGMVQDYLCTVRKGVKQ